MRCAQVGRDPGEQPNAEATGRRNKIIEGNRLLNILLFFAFLFFQREKEPKIAHFSHLLLYIKGGLMSLKRKINANIEIWENLNFFFSTKKEDDDVTPRSILSADSCQLEIKNRKTREQFKKKRKKNKIRCAIHKNTHTHTNG